MSYEPISYVQIVGGGAVNWYELPVREGRCFEPRDCPAVDWNEWSPEMADAGMTERLVQVKDGRWAKCSVGPDEGLWGGRLVEPEEAAVWLGKNGHEEAARALTDAPGRPVERERGGAEEQFVQEGRHNKYGLPLRRLADHVQPKLQLLCRYYLPAFHETLAVYDDGQMLRGSEQCDSYNANGGVPAPPDQPLPTR